MNQVAMLLGALCSLGLGTICVKLIAEARERDDEEQERRIIALVLGVPLLLSGLLIVGCLPFLSPLAAVLLGDPDLRLELLIAVVSVPLNVLLVSASAVLLGWGRGSALSALGITGAVLGTVLTVALVLIGGGDALVWTVLATSLAPAVATVALQPQVVRHLSWRMLPDVDYRRALRGPAAGTLISMALFFGGETLVRAVVLARLGPEINGLYQPVAVLRGQLMAPLIAGIVLVLMPSLTRLITSGDRQGAKAEILLAWRVNLLLIVSVSLLVVALRHVYVVAAFSSAFLPATNLVLLLMPGEVLIAGVFVLNAALLPAGHPRWYFAINVTTILVQVAVSLSLLPLLGVRSLVVGFTTANAVALALHWRALSGSGLLPRAHLWLVLAGFGLIAGSALVVYIAGFPAELLPLVLAVAWPFLATSRAERSELRRRVRAKFRRRGSVDAV
jgi:O-antigen/teichoic acid export membrane protein